MSNRRLETLQNAFDRFWASIESLTEKEFLQKIDDWTPRDVAAHLTWWNNNMLVACKDLQRGKAPSYYADIWNDYRNVNAQAIMLFPATDRRVLHGQARSTFGEFREYLLALDANEWDADRGVTHPRGGPATISRIVESLTGDYQAHIRQVEEWKAAVRKG